jgi:hypothetical protein
MDRLFVYELINGERDYQDKRWTSETSRNSAQHSPEEWFTYIRDYIEEAQHILCRESFKTSDTKAMDIMRKVAAMAVCAIEQNGAPARVDIKMPLLKIG